MSRLRTTRRSSLRFSPRRLLLPDEVAHTRIFAAAFNGESVIDTVVLDAGAGVDRVAQCAVIPQDPARRRTRAHARPSGKTETSQSRRAVTFVRTRWGVSDPRPNGVRGRLRGVAEGVAHAPGSLDTIIRAASAAAQN